MPPRRVALAALAGVLAYVAGLARRGDRLGGLELLDRRGSYTPAEAAALPSATVRRLKRRDSHTLPTGPAAGLGVSPKTPLFAGDRPDPGPVLCLRTLGFWA